MPEFVRDIFQRKALLAHIRVCVCVLILFLVAFLANMFVMKLIFAGCDTYIVSLALGLGVREYAKDKWCTEFNFFLSLFVFPQDFLPQKC